MTGKQTEETPPPPAGASLADEIGARAGRLMAGGRMHCAEAALTALNEGLGGGLSREQALGLAVGLGEGMGGAGCACGALTGSLLGLGLLLGGLGRRKVMALGRELHDFFRSSFGSTCCRVIGRRSGRRRANLDQCAVMTATTAAKAAELILARRPVPEQPAPAARPPRSAWLVWKRR